MNNIISGIVVFIIIIIWTHFILKSIENKKLKKYIIFLSALLLLWILLRTIKYSFVKDENIKVIIWYLYYFPMLFSATTFFNICTWNNKNKKHIKILRITSVIGSFILFLLVITNNIHNLFFKFNATRTNLEREYTYGFMYYIYFIWMFFYIAYSIIDAIKESRGYYKKQKFLILFFMFILIFAYAIGYIKKIPIVSVYFKDFTLIYSIFFMFALMIVVYKEKYKQALEEQLYEEIETAIKDKTIMINKKIRGISKSENPKRDLAYIKMLVSYCKRKSNLIVIEKDRNDYSSIELEMFIKETIKDANTLGINGEVNVINKFDMPIYIASIIYAYVYNLFEYCSNYNNTNMLISVEKIKDEININTMIDSKNKLEEFEYNYEMNNFLNNQKITQNQSKYENSLNINLKIPVDISIIKSIELTEKENNALLGMKSKIHDILGQRLSVVSSVLEMETIDENKIEEIKPLLKNILDDLDSNKQVKPNEMLMQIIHTCELAGTKIYIVGNLPKNYLKAITLVRIIRECSTNAIRHAKAQNIYIKIIEKDKVEMTISNDGNKTEKIIEGDGIKGMRNRVKELNGNLEIITDNDFTIKVEI